MDAGLARVARPGVARLRHIFWRSALHGRAVEFWSGGFLRRRLAAVRDTDAGRFLLRAALANYETPSGLENGAPYRAIGDFFRALGGWRNAVEAVDAAQFLPARCCKVRGQLVRWHAAVRLRALPGDGRRRARDQILHRGARQRSADGATVRAADHRATVVTQGAAQSAFSLQRVEHHRGADARRRQSRYDEGDGTAERCVAADAESQQRERSDSRGRARVGARISRGR